MEKFKREHTFFNKGDKVQIKQDIDHKPSMIVKDIKKAKFKDEDRSPNFLLGVVCFWFDSNNRYQEATFNTKDLEKC